MSACETRRIGITGAIGSGKSFVARLLAQMGYPVYDADSQAKRLIVDDHALRQEIIALLGEDSFLPDGSYNTSFVAKKVFSDPALLQKLNALVHPAVYADFLRWSCKHSYNHLCFIESALLPQLTWTRELDGVIVVSAPPEIRVRRVMKRDHTSEEQVNARMSQQADELDFLKIASIEIVNDNDADLETQVKQAIRSLIDESK